MIKRTRNTRSPAVVFDHGNVGKFVHFWNLRNWLSSLCRLRRHPSASALFWVGIFYSHITFHFIPAVFGLNEHEVQHVSVVQEPPIKEGNRGVNFASRSTCRSSGYS